MKVHLLLFTAIFAGFVAVNAPATITHYVDANGTNPVAPYLTWATAATNIQDALLNSAQGHVVMVTNGVYQYGSLSLNGSSRAACINNGVIIQSVNGPAVTTIVGYHVPGTTNGSSAIRCVYLSSGSILSGFTLTNGATQTGGTPYGGGVYCADKTSLVTNCVIVGNAAYSLAGGAYSGSLVNCQISGNGVLAIGASGGGCYESSLINCLLTRNYAGYRGAAAEGCSLINCTVVTNIAQVDGIDGCTLKNCISYYNFPDDGGQSGDGNNFTNCCFTTVLNFVNVITNPPVFANLSGGDFHLNAASPCINTGNNSYITNTTDLDGNPRIVGGIVDLGAYEFQAVVHYVKLANATPASPYTNWVTAATNIQSAINAANSGDFVVVSNGVYNFGSTPTGDGENNRVVVTQPMALQSVNGPAVTLINGGDQFRCVYLTNGAVLNGFTLTNGYAANVGGVYCASNVASKPNAVVENCLIIKNAGLLSVFSGTVSNCTITGNVQFGVSSSTLYNCVISGNGAGVGYSTMYNCIVSNNADGGIDESEATGCQIVDNLGTMEDLCGAYDSSLTNCLLAGNVGYAAGGATYSTLVNCTIVNNGRLSQLNPGGVLGCTLENCIIYGNTNGNYSGGSELLNNCDTFPLPSSGFGNITNDPAFVNPTSDFHLASDSPCINSGNNAYVADATDLDGNPRIQGGTVDTGAYEYQTPTSVISYAYLQQYGLPTDGSVDSEDLDGTGFDVYQDWIAGLNPTNPASVLVLLPPAPTNNASGITVTWQSVSGINYNLQRADQSLQSSFVTIQSNIVGQAGTTSYLDTSATNPVPYFYRVGVP